MENTIALNDKQVVLLEQARKAAAACVSSLYPDTPFDFDYELGMDYIKIDAISTSGHNLCLSFDWYFGRA